MNKYKEVNIKHTCSQFPRLFGHTSTIVRAYPKIGRNELCPCESGKKYKKCCLRNENSKNT